MITIYVCVSVSMYISKPQGKISSSGLCVELHDLCVFAQNIVIDILYEHECVTHLNDIFCTFSPLFAPPYTYTHTHIKNVKNYHNCINY